MRQFSATAFPYVLRWGPLLLATAAAITGCRREQVTAYSVPKDAAAPAPKTAVSGHLSGPVAVQWTAPAGWEEQPASGMRVGSFLARKGDQQADVSIIPLGGISGSELDNVNRWRGQVGLPKLEPNQLAEASEKAAIGTTPSSLYDMAGTDPQTKKPTRILASILSTDGTAWFFKMTGPDALVAEQKPAFKEFLKSVHLQPQGQNGGPVASAPEMGRMADKMPLDAVHGAGSSEKPSWQVPAGWQEQQPTSMRVATFLVTNEKGGKADVSVIKLAGTAGGMLANVNRWRSQIGLAPVDNTGLESLLSTREVSGQKITFVDIAGRNVESGEASRLLAAVVPRGGSSWFYKMLGNDQLVAQQKEAFVKFVESARYPNAS